MAAASSTIPHDVRLVAAVSRLVDLHQSRRESGVYVPETQERSGYMLALALLILDVMREIEMERGPGPVAIGVVFKMVTSRVSTVTAEDIDFVIDSISREREIRYGVEDGHGGMDFGLTKDSTPLIEKTRGFSQVQLSENARLLLRVSAMKESWLYSDLDAERLVKAIERGQFGDIPRFCRMMILEIATKNKQLSSALERPTLAELREMLVASGSHIAESMHEATEVVKRASALIFDAHTIAKFDRWQYANGVAYTIGNLQTEIELVMQNVEALSRRFIKFLDAAQRARPSGGSGIPFLSIIEGLTQPWFNGDASRLSPLLAGLMPWGQFQSFFNPTLMVGAVDSYGFDGPAGSGEATTFTLDPGQGPGHGRLMDFILRNRVLVVDRLRAGPAAFSTIVAQTGFILEPGESPVDFFGIYSAPEHLDGEDLRIVVGLTGESFEAGIDGARYSGTDPMVFLMKDAA
ncbi:MAG: hypothetical protein ACYDEV_11115 [Acidiferrobacter sp.]